MSDDTPQPPADAREVIARAMCRNTWNDPDVKFGGQQLWEHWAEEADIALSCLRALPLASRLAAISVDPATHGMGFTEALAIAQRGFDTWKDKPHNVRWFRKIDGTPIPNDLLVNIAMAFVAAAEDATDGR